MRKTVLFFKSCLCFNLLLNFTFQQLFFGQNNCSASEVLVARAWTGMANIINKKDAESLSSNLRNIVTLESLMENLTHFHIRKWPVKNHTCPMVQWWACMSRDNSSVKAIVAQLVHKAKDPASEAYLSAYFNFLILILKKMKKKCKYYQ